MQSLSAFDQIPASYSPSSDISTGTNITTGESISNATSSQNSEALTPPQRVTRKRKRRNSTVIIKPARWSPPLHHHRQSNTHLTATPIETDFQPTFYNPNEIKHRRRISSQQYGILEDEYSINAKPNASKRHHLAELLGMTPRTVQIWFQNKRAKAKHQQPKSSNSEKKPSGTPTNKRLMATSTQSSLSHSSSATAALESFDQLTFDDGRLDPIYLMDDYEMTAFMATSCPPSLSPNTSTVTSNQKSSSAHDKKNVTEVQQPGTADDHGIRIAATASSSTSSSPLLSLSDTYDSFSMIANYPANNNHYELQYYDETPFSDSTASSSPSQQFSPGMSSFTYDQFQNTDHRIDTYLHLDSLLKENNNTQEHLLRNDTLYIPDWMQKTPTDLTIGGSILPSFPYVINQPDLQNDYLNFGLAHDDWMNPFSVSA